MTTRPWWRSARARALVTALVTAASLGLGAVPATAAPAAATTAGDGALTPSALSAYGYHALESPVRVLDTRTGTGGISGAVPSGATITVPVAPLLGLSGADIYAVIMNVTVVEPTGTGYVSIFPAGSGAPTVSSVNFEAGRTTPNLVTVRVRAGDGGIAAYNFGGSSHLLYDVVGWFGNETADPAGAEYVSVTPARIYDSRTNALAIAGGLAPGQPFTLTTPEPAEFSSGVYNVTITGAKGTGFVSVYPADAPLPNASNLNITPGRDVANMVVVRRGNDAGRSITIFNGTSDYLHFVFDGAGAFYSGPTDVNGIFIGTTPYRYYDTRVPGQSSGIIAAGEANARRLIVPSSIPADATALVVNLTVADPTTSSWASIFPGRTWPGSSTVNYVANAASANIAIVKLLPPESSGNRIMSIMVGGGYANVIVDVFGYYR